MKHSIIDYTAYGEKFDTKGHKLSMIFDLRNDFKTLYIINGTNYGVAYYDVDSSTEPYIKLCNVSVTQ